MNEDSDLLLRAVRDDDLPTLQRLVDELHMPLPRAVLFDAAENRGPIFEFLVSRGASLDERDEEGRSLIDVATGSSLVALVRLHPAALDSVNDEPDCVEQVAFNLCCDESLAPLLERLILEHGLNVGAVDEEGFTLLHHAIRNGNAAAVSVLLRHGAQPQSIHAYFDSQLDDTSIAIVGLLLDHDHRLFDPESHLLVCAIQLAASNSYVVFSCSVQMSCAIHSTATTSGPHYTTQQSPRKTRSL
jgi:ankyrin repeat protein